MKYIVPIPEKDFPETFKSIWLAGPQTGLDSCGVLASRVPPGHQGPALHVHPIDQFYYILRGTANIQIGTDQFLVGADTLVHFPAGTPHRNWNASDEYEMHLELFVPTPPSDGLLTFVEPRKVDNAASLIHRIDPAGWPDRAFASQHLVHRDNGSKHARIYAAKLRDGASGPSLHFHQFDQLYFIVDGVFDVQIGLTKMLAPKHSLVILPAGILHTNLNSSGADETHLTFIIPEPKAGEQFDYKVDVKYENTPAFS